MTLPTNYSFQLIATGIIILIVLILRLVNAKLVRAYARKTNTFEHRTNLVIKYINLFLLLLGFTLISVIWGVNIENIFVTFSTIFTVIGVGLVAQWSVLSNVTSGIILFFSAPFKIGDTIKIHDKDFPIEAEIEDIKAFYTYFKTKSGEHISYPNNLLLQKGITIVKEPDDSLDFTD